MQKTIFVVLALASTAARADQCPLIAGGSPVLAQQDAQARIEFLKTALQEDSFKAQQWQDGWSAAYAFLTAAFLSTAVAGTVTPNQPGDSPAVKQNNSLVALLRTKRAQLYDSAATSFIGLGSAAILPPKGVYDGPAFSHLLALGNLTPCALIAKGELFLLQDAHSEEFGRGWVVNVLNALVNIAAGLVLGIAYHDWTDAAITTVVGAGIGEAMIWTTPTNAITALGKYRVGDFAPIEKPRVQFEAHGPSFALRF